MEYIQPKGSKDTAAGASFTSYLYYFLVLLVGFIVGFVVNEATSSKDHLCDVSGTKSTAASEDVVMVEAEGWQDQAGTLFPAKPDSASGIIKSVMDDSIMVAIEGNPSNQQVVLFNQETTLTALNPNCGLAIAAMCPRVVISPEELSVGDRAVVLLTGKEDPLTASSIQVIR